MVSVGTLQIGFIQVKFPNLHVIHQKSCTDEDLLHLFPISNPDWLIYTFRARDQASLWDFRMCLFKVHDLSRHVHMNMVKLMIFHSFQAINILQKLPSEGIIWHFIRFIEKIRDRDFPGANDWKKNLCLAGLRTTDSIQKLVTKFLQWMPGKPTKKILANGACIDEVLTVLSQLAWNDGRCARVREALDLREARTKEKGEDRS